MTRRIFVYLCDDGSFAVSPEFNGDREEFKHFKMGDSYDLSFREMCQIMERVASLEEFKEAVMTLFL